MQVKLLQLVPTAWWGPPMIAKGVGVWAGPTGTGARHCHSDCGPAEHALRGFLLDACLVENYDVNKYVEMPSIYPSASIYDDLAYAAAW